MNIGTDISKNDAMNISTHSNKYITDHNLIINFEHKDIKKMIFIFNALENGWIIKKQKDCYIFKKKHEGKKEIFNDNYLSRFVEESCNFKKK
jgi:hypothetical protein